VTGSKTQRERGDRDIHVISSWVLRTGVVSSVAVMLLGLVLAFARGAPTVEQMEHSGFSADFPAIFRGAAALEGVALIELGILMLVLTPVLRVASSMVIFATEERDWLYAGLTAVVLALTLVSLVVLR
jgi:uncharacterized membrane protein